MSVNKYWLLGRTNIMIYMWGHQYIITYVLYNNQNWNTFTIIIYGLWRDTKYYMDLIIFCKSVKRDRSDAYWSKYHIKYYDYISVCIYILHILVYNNIIIIITMNICIVFIDSIIWLYFTIHICMYNNSIIEMHSGKATLK